jgi:Family of unknown function (DUF6489)
MLNRAPTWIHRRQDSSGSGFALLRLQPALAAHGGRTYTPPLREATAESTARRRGPMKITVNIDCTPEEARAFLGLPDIRPMQEELMREVQERMAASIRTMQPEEMLRLWSPANMKGFDQLQEFFLQIAGKKRG